MTVLKIEEKSLNKRYMVGLVFWFLSLKLHWKLYAVAVKFYSEFL